MEDHLNAGRVRGRGVVVVHGSVGAAAARREHGCDEMSCGVHVSVGSCGGCLKCSVNTDPITRLLARGEEFGNKR